MNTDKSKTAVKEQDIELYSSDYVFMDESNNFIRFSDGQIMITTDEDEVQEEIKFGSTPIRCTDLSRDKQAELIENMKANSINSNGCSVCEQGKENYTTFIAGAFRGTEYYQYDYRHSDGELFSCIGKSLEECQQKRDKWLIDKQ